MYRFLKCIKLNFISLSLTNTPLNYKFVGIYIYKYISSRIWFFILKKITFIINKKNLNIFYKKNLTYIINEIYFLLK